MSTKDQRKKALRVIAQNLANNEYMTLEALIQDAKAMQVRIYVTDREDVE